MPDLMKSLGKPAAIAAVVVGIHYLVNKYLNNQGKYLSDIKKAGVLFLEVFLIVIVVGYLFKNMGGGGFSLGGLGGNSSSSYDVLGI